MIFAPSAYTLSGLATWLDYFQPGMEALDWHVTLGLVEGPRYHRVQRYLEAHPSDRWAVVQCKTGTAAGRRYAIGKALTSYTPDIVLSVNIPDVIPAVAAYRSKPGGPVSAIRAVMTVHGIQPDLYADVKAFRPFLDAVVCTNRLAAKLASVFARMDRSRVFYAPYGVDITKLSREILVADRLRIAYVGRLERDQKRIQDLPNILHELEMRSIPYYLKIAGSGPEDQWLRKKVLEANLSGQVEFLGHVAPSEMNNQVYDCSDVLLLTSEWETGPIVLWEAMACGCLVVSSRYIGSGAENALVNGMNASLFDIGAADQAANHLEQIWMRQKDVKAMQSNARDLVRTRYSISSSVKNWDTVMEAIIQRVPIENHVVPPQPRISGRLDRVLGTRAAEAVRTVVRTPYAANDPGDEWPHTIAGGDYHDPEFWHRMRRLDESARTKEQGRFV